MEINPLLQPGSVSTDLVMITGEHVATVETIKFLKAQLASELRNPEFLFS